MKLIIFVFLNFYINIIFSQNISGIIKDSKTGETLPNVIIFNDTKQIGVTNSYGYYSIKIREGNKNLKFSLIGYFTSLQKISNKDTLLNINLEPYTTTLSEVILNTKKNKIHNLQISTLTLTQEKIKTIPSLTGTPDILKVFQLLPGVQTANEGTTNLNIRGGSYDQNLILLDEAPIYNPAHALGFFSTFNADAIKTATIYKGNFPAQYGGRLSAVIDIIMKDGNNQKFNTDISIGLTANQFTVQGPIKKNKTSFLFSFRNSNVSNLLKVVNFFYPTINIKPDDNIRFWDNNIKINHIINQNNKLFFSFYTSFDNYNFNIFSVQNNLNWSNISSTIRWNHIFNKTLFSNLSLYGTQYTSLNKNISNVKNYEWFSGIKEIGLKNDFTKYLANSNTIKFGYAVAYRNINPGVIEQKDSNSFFQNKNQNINNNIDVALYISKEQILNNKLSILYGIRTTWFADIGPHNQYKIESQNGFIDTNIYTSFGKIRNNFFSFEPRITARYLINENSSLKTSITISQQNIHLISNSTAGLPYDYWISASKEIKPQTSTQFLIGYFTELFNKKLSVSIEAYYKTMDNILDFKDNSNLLTEKNIELNVIQGIGKSYGIEFFIEKQFGKLNGWISYTLAKTQYKVPNVNNNEWYSPRYDIRHNLSLVAFYKINQRFELSSTFKYTSGGFISFPTRSFKFAGAVFSVYDSKNNYELPAYNRLDVSLKYRGKKYEKRKLKKEWVFTLYNVYGQENIFSLVVRPTAGKEWNDNLQNAEENATNGSKAYYFYLFGLIPTITLNLKF